MLACTAPPEREIREAREAVGVARAARADRDAPEVFAAAAAALDRSREAFARHDYRRALAEAQDATARARDAAAAAADQQAAMSRTADRAIEVLSLTVSRVREAIGAVEAGQPAPAAQRAISDARRTIVVANVALQKAREAISHEDYRAASATCEEATERLEAAIRTLAPTHATPAVRRRD